MANNDNKQNQGGLDGREIPAICMLLACAGWYKYGHVIEIWFFNNMIKLVVGGIALLIAGGYILYLRMQKKDKEEIKRMQRLAQAKAPTRKVDAYYQRNQEGGHEE